MVAGTINPGQLVIVREILPGAGGFDTANFGGPSGNYAILFEDNGTPADPADDVVLVQNNDPTLPTIEVDRLSGIERLQFSDQAIVPVPGLTNEPEGSLVVSDTTPAVGQTLTVSAAGITAADNIIPTDPTGPVTGPISGTTPTEGQPLTATNASPTRTDSWASSSPTSGSRRWTEVSRGRPSPARRRRPSRQRRRTSTPSCAWS